MLESSNEGTSNSSNKSPYNSSVIEGIYRHIYNTHVKFNKYIASYNNLDTCEYDKISSAIVQEIKKLKTEHEKLQKEETNKEKESLTSDHRSNKLEKDNKEEQSDSTELKNESEPNNITKSKNNEFEKRSNC